MKVEQVRNCMPCGTILEGDWDKIMNLIKKYHKKSIKDSDHVLTSITIDDRKGRTGRIAGKVKSVEKKPGKKLIKGM